MLLRKSFQKRGQTSIIRAILIEKLKTQSSFYIKYEKSSAYPIFESISKDVSYFLYIIN